MEQLEKVRKGLQTAVDSDWMWQKADYIAMICKDALALINAQQERIAELEAGQKWISVKDRLPTESDGTVLVCYPNQSPYNLLEPHMNAKHDRRVSTGCYSQHSCTWYHGDMCGVGGADPIAWMPLPEPAKEEDNANQT